MSNYYLIIYIVIWVIITYRVWKQNRRITSIVFLYGCYSIFAIMSYLLYNDPERMGSFKELNLFPFVYLMAMVLIISYPIRKFDEYNIYRVQEPTTWKLNVFAGLFIFTSLLSLPGVINNLYKIPMLVFDSSTGLDSYRASIEAGEANKAGTISNIPAIINGLYSKIGALLLFYCLTIEKKNKWIIAGLAYSLFSWMLYFITSGQRGGLYHTVLVLAASYFLMSRFLNEKIRKIVAKVGVIFIILVSIPTIAVTISRFGEGSHSGTNPLSSTYYYMGQSSLYFNNYGLDNNGIRYGDRTLCLFKKMVGFSDVPMDYVEGRTKYPHLYIGDEVFSTFVGDFTFDFGPMFAFLLFIFCTILFYQKTKPINGVLPFHRLIIIFVIMDVCSDGAMFLFPYGYMGNLTLIFYILAIMFFRYDYYKQTSQK